MAAHIPDPDSLERAATLARENGASAEQIAALGSIAGLSRSIGRWLGSHPKALARFAAPRAAGSILEEARAIRQAHTDLRAAIRELRQVETARAVAADLSGESVARVNAALAEIASACFSLALDEELAAITAADEAGARIPFAVVGMGKLGGAELNVSSDVDVIYVYGTDRGTAGASTPHEVFARAATRITRALADATDDGIAFRVDLDLRPEGTRGPIVNSLRSLEVYYESYGRTWERAAWLKARAVAGDPALGDALLRSMEPFVYRKWLDYTTLDAIREMKDKIDGSRASRDAKASSIARGYDVKLGAGGIREAEFFVQALQLVNAGKRPELRARGTLDALARLSAAELVREEEASRLARAYEFLRRLENRLQARELAQTHTLPTDDAELGVIACSMGFPREGSQLLEALAGHRAAVAEAFDGLFREKTRSAAKSAGPEVALLADESLSEDASLSLTTSLRLFTDPRSAADAFARIRRGPARSRQKEQAFRFLARIAPTLFAELRASADPDAAIVNLERFLGKIGGRTTLLALLAEHPPTLSLLARLFGSSDFLSRALIARPELLDVLVGAGTAEPRRSRAQLRADLARQIAGAPDPEAKLDALRRFRVAETLRIGMADLWGRSLDLAALQAELSHLAEVVTERAVGIAGEQEDFHAEEAGLVVLGLGRFGGREMAWASDVDLVFFCEQVSERHVKLAQRVISALSAPTREGIAYRVDTRLRPSGSKGPLVVSASAFREYHRGSARTWEHQALTRARPVAGSRHTWALARKEIQNAVFSTPRNAISLATEIAEMREQLEKQIGRGSAGTYNLKTGRGGLVDVEFAAQFLQLLHGVGDPFLRTPHTGHALRRARAAGHVSHEDFAALSEGYVFLSHLENRLRIVTDHPTDEMASEDSAWESAARRAGLGQSGVELRKETLRISDAVRAAFQHVVKGSPST